MKKAMTKTLCFLLMLGCFLLSTGVTACSNTRGFGGREDIHGLVVDGKNRPVGGFKIVINKKTFFSNETGLFTLRQIKAGTYRVHGSKLGYLTVDKDITINEKKGLVYMKITSIEEILEQADALFLEKKWKNAEEILAQAIVEKEGRGPDIVQFYYAIALFKQQKYHEALLVMSVVHDEFSSARDFKTLIQNHIARTAHEQSAPPIPEGNIENQDN